MFAQPCSREGTGDNGHPAPPPPPAPSRPVAPGRPQPRRRRPHRARLRPPSPAAASRPRRQRPLRPRLGAGPAGAAARGWGRLRGEAPSTPRSRLGTCPRPTRGLLWQRGASVLRHGQPPSHSESLGVLLVFVVIAQQQSGCPCHSHSTKSLKHFLGDFHSTELQAMLTLAKVVVCVLARSSPLA